MNSLVMAFLTMAGVVAVVWHRQIRNVAAQVRRLAQGMHKEFNQ